MAETIELSRTMLAAAGAAGAALAAAASHAHAADLGIAASFLQLHAPALIGIAFLRSSPWAMAAGYVLIVGLLLFAGDLAARTWLGASPFPPAAPVGGTALIVGWLLLVVAALAWRRR